MSVELFDVLLLGVVDTSHALTAGLLSCFSTLCLRGLAALETQVAS